MRTRLHLGFLLVMGSLFWPARPAVGQTALVPAPSREAMVVDAAAGVLAEIMAIPVKSIPQSLLAKAEGIVIIPGMLKGGFIVGVRHGRGVVVLRDEAGRWKPPTFVEITGASVGWQVGIQGTDLVLVLRTRSSLKNLMQGKFTIGVHASAAAGPVGREAEAATDASFRAEILSYSRSRGLFIGLALDGAELSVDYAATKAYYQPAAGNSNQPGQPSPLPASADRLLAEIAKYTTAPAVLAGVAAGARPAAGGPEAIRRQLAGSSQQLAAIMDPAWRTFLALPAEVYAGDRPPSAEALRLSLDHFTTAATDPRYQALAQRTEFQATWSLLRQYSAAASPTARPLSLPPPPQ
jgi:SH3 domain-containing YSC84-like protein 1